MLVIWSRLLDRDLICLSNEVPTDLIKLNLSIPKQNQRAVTDVMLCSALLFPGLLSMILKHTIKEVIDVPKRYLKVQ